MEVLHKVQNNNKRLPTNFLETFFNTETDQKTKRMMMSHLNYTFNISDVRYTQYQTNQQSLQPTMMILSHSSNQLFFSHTFKHFAYEVLTDKRI